MNLTQTAVINGHDIKNMLLGAYAAFAAGYRQIDELNVFPVPDGDTGTNMMRTMEEVHRALLPLDTDSAAEVGAAAAKSAIMGARGNSGVILSQLLRGIGRGLAGKARVTGNELGKAFQFGILYAYRSVAKPVEGTILTVARGIAKEAYHAVRRGEDFTEILTEAIAGGKKELARTPELLPALKAAGVVDAGGQGLIVFLQGCLNGLLGKNLPEEDVQHISVNKIAALPAEEVDLTNPYCTEFIVKNTAVDDKTVRAALSPLGNSLIVAAMDDVVKVHIHTANPGVVLQQALEWGTLHDIKIDNMAEQHEHRVFSAAAVQQPALKKEGTGLVSVAAGSGIEARYYAACGVHQTGAEISHRAQLGEDIARQTIENAGRAGWTNIFDPDIAVVSGSVTKAGPIWRGAMVSAFKERTPGVLADLPIVDASLGDNAPLIGVAENLLDTLKN